MTDNHPIWQVSAASTALRREPGHTAALDTELLHGEQFRVLEEQGRWVRGIALLDGYEGWAEKLSFSSDVFEPTHRVTALRSYRFSQPDLKSAPLNLISMNALVQCETAREGRFLQDARGGWLFADHVQPVDTCADDYVAVAEKFMGAPYYWGGRTSLGLDCSALVQNAMAQICVKVPRDSGPQRTFFAREPGSVLFDTSENDQSRNVGEWQDLSLQRGDLVFWSGHVVIMVDGENIVHANATHMAVTRNNLKEFADKIRESDGDVVSVCRPRVADV
ncbi:MAG: C40 family peptidase [Aquisalinus sp.]|nr:C40 family peptidase [Aquisalinus sp.]